MEINYFKNVKAPTVLSSITTNQWFEMVKHSKFSDAISIARENENDFVDIKSSLPCITYTFLFDGYKKNEYITSATGLLYIDIDDLAFDINSIDVTKVHAYYKSVSGRGYAIIVKVDGLTTDNYKDSYNYICNDLGIISFVDTNAAKASQFSILSYDPNIFINDNCFIYDINNITLAPPSVVITREKKTYTIDGGANYSIRYNNLDEIKFDGDYTVNWDGYEFINCFIPLSKKRTTGERNDFLLGYANNLLWLNQHITKEKLFSIMLNVNQVGCLVPVDDSQVMRVVNSVWGYKENKTLQPIINLKKRKIVFSNKSKLNREDKLEICRQEMAIKRSNDSKEKLYNILESWDFELLGLINQRNVIKNHPISKKTVEKYWSEFKDYVKELNNNFKKEAITEPIIDSPILDIQVEEKVSEIEEKQHLIEFVKQTYYGRYTTTIDTVIEMIKTGVIKNKADIENVLTFL